MPGEMSGGSADTDKTKPGRVGSGEWGAGGGGGGGGGGRGEFTT